MRSSVKIISTKPFFNITWKQYSAHTYPDVIKAKFSVDLAKSDTDCPSDESRVKLTLDPFNSWRSFAACAGWLNLNILVFPNRITAPTNKTKQNQLFKVKTSFHCQCFLLGSEAEQMNLPWVSFIGSCICCPLTVHKPFRNGISVTVPPWCSMTQCSSSTSSPCKTSNTIVLK